MRVNASGLLAGSSALIISEDTDGRTALQQRLARAGMAVVVSDSARNGLALAQRRPDVIIVDTELSDMSGPEVATTLRLNPLTQPIPIIQRSVTEVSETEWARGLEAGADALIVEPVGRQVLLAIVAAQLRHSELSRQLETALSLDNTGVYDWSLPTGEVRWTASLERMYGLDEGDFGGTFDDFVASIHPDDREQVAAELDDAIANRDELAIAFRFVRADGSTRWVESRGRVFRDLDEVPVRVMGLAHDVTERVVERQRVEQLRRLASGLTAARTTRRVLSVLAEELDGTSLAVRLAQPAEPDGGGDRDVAYAYRAGDVRLELVEVAGHHDQVTHLQATAIGELAGTALDRALRFEAERSNAIALQRALLPATLPQIDGWWIDTEYVPAAEADRLGGDFFDALDLEECFVVFIGDVAGHGLAATTQMGTVRTLLRTLAAIHDGRPDAVLAHARRVFDRVCGASSPFVSACVARFGHDGTVEIGSAGHPPPILRRAGGAVLAEVEPAPPLGTFSEADDTMIDIRLDVDDWIVFYTDGVFERRDRSLDATIADVAVGISRAVSADDFVRLGEAAAGKTNHDDRAVVVVRRMHDG